MPRRGATLSMPIGEFTTSKGCSVPRKYQFLSFVTTPLSSSFLRLNSTDTMFIFVCRLSDYQMKKMKNVKKLIVVHFTTGFLYENSLVHVW